MPALHDSAILILATHGFEQSELEVPRDDLRTRGACVHVASPDGQSIRGWRGADWGDEVAVDKPLSQVDADAYDALVLPGGQINPDLLRVEEDVIRLIRQFHDSGRMIAAICHAPWLLIEADVVRGRRMTSYASIRTDMINAGAQWTDAPAMADAGLVTSRNPGDLTAFCDKIAENIIQGRHERRQAA